MITRCVECKHNGRDDERHPTSEQIDRPLAVTRRALDEVTTDATRNCADPAKDAVRPTGANPSERLSDSDHLSSQERSPGDPLAVRRYFIGLRHRDEGREKTSCHE
jgi:hypothetical protein